MNHRQKRLQIATDTLREPEVLKVAEMLGHEAADLKVRTSTAKKTPNHKLADFFNYNG